METPASPLIARSRLTRDALKGEVVVVTGAGRGIGYEAASALLWLGARVAIAEVNEKTGTEASDRFRAEYGQDRVIFVKTDIGNEDDIARLAGKVNDAFGKVDAVLNNATAAQIGAVKDAPIGSWDLGYHVDLRGPVLLARAFLPEMLRRKHGVFVCVSSSGAAPNMGPYEVFKTAQVELANTIASEVEGTGVFAFTIGPGIVRTPGFLETGSKVARLMGITTEQLIEMNKAALLTPEEAGVGFAASVALASKYHGSETSSIQVLRDIGIASSQEEAREEPAAGEVSAESISLFERVLKTYTEQSQGWRERGMFQRQWVLRDFKKQTGMTVDEMLTALNQFGESLQKRKAGSPAPMRKDSLGKLASYYKHQQELLHGFERDPKKLEEGMKALQSWIDDIQALLANIQ